MLKLPEIKVGIVAVSRDCFPVTLSKERKERVVKEYGKGLTPTTFEKVDTTFIIA